MTSFLFLLYVSVLLFVIEKSSLFKFKGVKIPLVSFVFILKVSISVFFLWIYKHKFGGADTWTYFDEAYQFYTTPEVYFKMLLGDFYPFNIPNSSLNLENYFNHYELSNFFMVKFNLLLLPLSQGNYYIHSIFMGFLMTIGFSYSYKIFKQYFLENSTLLVIILCFPFTFLFHTSGIHKDGFIYLFMMVFLFYLHQSFRSTNTKNVIFTLVSLFLLGVIRKHILVIIIPLYFAYLASELFTKKYKFIFIKAIISQAIIGVVLVIVIKGKLNLLEKISEMKVIFNNFGGGSHFETPGLNATWGSMIQYFPTAFKNGLTRPFIQDANNLFQIISSFEVYSLIGVVTISILYRKKEIQWNSQMNFILGYGLSIGIFYGYVCTNSGAIIRYRSLGFYFIFIYFLVFILDLSLFRSKILIKTSKSKT